MIRRLASSACLLLLLAACDAAPESGVLEPVIAEAPGGEKGKPGGNGGTQADPVLEEYFITEVDGAQSIHVVASGSVSTIGASTMLDHFHDGVGDDDPPYDTHYEYYLPGSEIEPLPTEIGQDLYHVDIPFAGEFLQYDPAIEDFVRLPLPDYPYMDVDGSGGDPWVFQLSVRSADSTSSVSGRFPVTGEDENVVGHAVIEPVVVHRGQAAANTVWVESLTLDALTCERTTIRSGRGKDRTVETVTHIQAEASFTTGATAVNTDGNYPWVELHLMDESTGALGERSTTTDKAATRTLHLDLDGEPASVDVTAIIDYVFHDPAWGVYDPSNNTVPTTAGASSTPFTGITALGDPAPYARSATVSVTCT